MSKEVLIIDYGLGNLFNVERAFVAVGADPKISSDPRDLERYPRACLPGVAAFGEGMKNLRERDLIEPIKKFAVSGRPLLGLCLGMQLLLSESEEHGLHKGLELIEGKVLRFPQSTKEHSFKVPHIGWNELSFSKEVGCLNGLSSGRTYMYFVHSFYVKPKDESIVSARTPYAGLDFCSVLKLKNIQGCQFHPERSGADGLNLLKNFLENKGD